MAFYNDIEDENSQDPNASGTGMQTQSGSQVIDGGGSGPSSAPMGPKTPDKPGNFVGLKDYLNANRVQAQKLGDKTAGYLNQGIQDANQAVGQLGSQFDEKVKGGQIGGFDGALDEGKGLINQAATQGVVSDEGKKRFGEIANASYQGPKTLTEASDIYQPTAQKVQKATKNANLTNSEEGKQELLRGMVNAPTYSTGAQRFDSYLLKDQAAQDQFKAAREQANALQTQLGAQEQAATQKGQTADAQSKALQEQIRAAFGRFDDPNTPENEATGAVGNYQTDIRNQLSQAQTDSDDLTGRFNSGALTMADLARFGIDNQADYGVNIKNYYQPGVASEAGVTDAAEKARYDALTQLGGLSGGMYGGAGAGDFGSYNPSVNKDEFLKAVGDSKNLWEDTRFNTFKDDIATRLSRAPDGQRNTIVKNAIRNAKSPEEIKAALDGYANWRYKKFSGSPAGETRSEASRYSYENAPGFMDYLNELLSVRDKKIAKEG